MLNLPFPLEPYDPPHTGSRPPNVRFEGFKGQSGGRKIFISHGTNTTLVGGVMLSWADRPLGFAAEKMNMDIISKNQATLLNGLRARRSDYISHEGNPRTRVRFVLLEGANQVWGIEIHAPETDPGAEAVFQRMAQSAQ